MEIHCTGQHGSVLIAVLLHSFSGCSVIEWNNQDLIPNQSLLWSSNDEGINRDKFLEVPQIVWGLNNQKIAFARDCLTARMLNRTFLVPSLSASFFYKEIDRLQPIFFDKIFEFDKFNSLCNGFVRLGRYSDLKNQTGLEYIICKREVEESGQLREIWSSYCKAAEDYARVFECLVLVDEMSKEADKVVSKIKQVGRKLRSKTDTVQNDSGVVTDGSLMAGAPYIAVHVRVEIDGMIHCKKSEKRSGINQICSSKQGIIERVGNTVSSGSPTVVYLAVADSILNDSSILSGWKKGLLSFEKKTLRVDVIYKKHPYLIQSAIDYEVCSRADIFVGNSFSTFSSLIVLERTQKMMRMGIKNSCGINIRWPSYAYNIPG
ncbi:hypothetical protein F3Y22_tig00117005pilonHSYRG00115 [Hibiscus syriacus]|uniref:O-fucosyltransferase family protein n=1 Tax=Hibiscus syriacus TaxID=106335 RepID=A0A6A2WFA4_HIBSY|nr:hypothetical protein F3Y22_tig00117005pilonHSYRG00115 [Hibiscus syriacus]